MSSVGKRSIIVAVTVVALALATSASALAATASQTSSPTYDLSFTLPTVGVSGCNVCHADPNLVRPGGETTQSVYINPADLENTAHPKTVCTGCHADFAYKTPHKNAQTDAWKDVAKSNCKNCHGAEAADIAAGAHSPAGKPGVSEQALEAERVANGQPAKVPLCGDCHGSHDIQYLTPEKWEKKGNLALADQARAGKKALHARGLELCGRCHEAEANDYADYYHGAAYRRGAPDAPACWDCHGAHKMLPAKDPMSPVNPAHLVETCGRCHKDVNENYTKYARMIHRRDQVESQVPLFVFFNSTRSVIQGAFETLRSLF